MLKKDNINEIETHPKPTLLLVDDDPLIAESLGFMLKKEYDVLIAETREDARLLLTKLDIVPFLALVDLGLPPVPHRPDEGFALIEELLAFDENIKILVLSGQDEDVNIQHALTVGAVDFIAKPVEPKVLLARLNLHKQIMRLSRKNPLKTTMDSLVSVHR